MKTLLQEVRRKNQITQKKLSMLSGISRKHIIDIENGKSIPTILTLCKLAKALGVPVEELYECDE